MSTTAERSESATADLPESVVDLHGRTVDVDVAALVDLRETGRQPPPTLVHPAPAFESEQGAWTVEPGPSTWFG